MRISRLDLEEIGTAAGLIVVAAVVVGVVVWVVDLVGREKRGGYSLSTKTTDDECSKQ